MALPPCWKIKNCGRETGGAKVVELGACPASPDHGHSCWIVAGTFCGGKVQGTFAAKYGTCLACDVYARYSTSLGTERQQLKQDHPEEWAACVKFLRDSRAPTR